MRDKEAAAEAAIDEMITFLQYVKQRRANVLFASEVFVALSAWLTTRGVLEQLGGENWNAGECPPACSANVIADVFALLCEHVQEQPGTVTQLGS